MTQRDPLAERIPDRQREREREKERERVVEGVVRGCGGWSGSLSPFLSLLCSDALHCEKGDEAVDAQGGLELENILTHWSSATQCPRSPSMLWRRHLRLGVNGSVKRPPAKSKNLEQHKETGR